MKSQCRTITSDSHMYIVIELRNEYSSMCSMRWEIERTFSILEEIMGSENIWYVNNRDYDNAIGLKTIAYNLMAISNIELGIIRVR